MESIQKESQIETAEEIEAEKQHLSEVKEDELRKEIVSEFGFDAEKDKEKIDKLVERETKHRKALSTTIGQKVKYREALHKNTPPKQSDAAPSKEDGKDLDERVNAGISAALEQRDLDEMEYPDEIKNAIKQVAAYNGVSVRKAEKDPYIVAKIETWQKQQGTDEAALSRNNKNGGRASGSSTDVTPPDVDLNTPEGRKAYDDWKAKMIAEGH